MTRLRWHRLAKFFASCIVAGMLSCTVRSIDPHDVRANVGAFCTYVVVTVAMWFLADLLELEFTTEGPRRPR